MKQLIHIAICLAAMSAHADPVSDVLAEVQAGPRLSAGLAKKSTWALLDAKTGKSLDISGALTKPERAALLVQEMAAAWLQGQAGEQVEYPGRERAVEQLIEVDVATECFGPDTTRKTLVSLIKWAHKNQEKIEAHRTFMEHVSLDQILVWAASYIPVMTEEFSAQSKFVFIEAFQHSCEKWFGPVNEVIKWYSPSRKQRR